MGRAEISPIASNLMSRAKRDLALVLELSLLALVGLGFALPFSDMNQTLTLPGRELQVHVGQIQLFADWLDGFSEFPLWNPAIGLGRSWIADPFLFAFNPFASIPMWFWGVNYGSKIAVVINFLIAGFGMWSVARLLGFRWPTRLWAAMLYMLSGGLVAHLQAGQVQLVFALGWLPWSFAGLLIVWQKKSYTAAALASLPQAIFYFSGNLYYQAYAAFCYVFILLILAVEWRPLKVNWPGLWKVFVLGILSLGLISIQFLPAFAARNDIANQGGYARDEREFYGSQKPADALVNYIVSDIEFALSPMLGKPPYIAESYRYIGISPFIFLLLIVPAFKRSHRKREVVAVALSFLILLSWAGVKYTFFKGIYHSLPFIYQFRFPGRALSVGAMFVILLGGFGLEELLTWINSLGTGFLEKMNNVRLSTVLKAGRALLFGIVLAGLAGSVRDVFVSNAKVAALEEQSLLTYDIGFRWLRDREDGAYTFGIFTTEAINIGRSLEAYTKQFRIMSLVDGWIPAGIPTRFGEPEAVTIGPKYWFLWDDEPMDQPEATLVHKLGALEIWETPTFPFAFTVPDGRFDLEPYAIEPSEVQPVVSYRRQVPNRILVETDTDEVAVLIVSEAWFSGWTASIEGEPVEIGSVSNLLAVRLPAGQHNVIFEYAPPGFKAGAMISLITLAGIAVIPAAEFVWKKRHPPAS